MQIRVDTNYIFGVLLLSINIVLVLRALLLVFYIHVLCCLFYFIEWCHPRCAAYLFRTFVRLYYNSYPVIHKRYNVSLNDTTCLTLSLLFNWYQLFFFQSSSTCITLSPSCTRSFPSSASSVTFTIVQR